MLTVVGDHAVCCLQHVQHCCIQSACMRIVSLHATYVLLCSIKYKSTRIVCEKH